MRYLQVQQTLWPISLRPTWHKVFICKQVFRRYQNSVSKAIIQKQDLEKYSELFHRSKIELFPKIVYDFRLL